MRDRDSEGDAEGDREGVREHETQKSQRRQEARETDTNEKWKKSERIRPWAWNEETQTRRSLSAETAERQTGDGQDTKMTDTDRRGRAWTRQTGEDRDTGRQPTERERATERETRDRPERETRREEKRKGRRTETYGQTERQSR